MQNAVMYARYSSDNQREESITAQVRAMTEYATDEKYNVIGIYKDEALTGTADDRDDFIRMIKDSKSGLFDTILVHKLDRFARNRYDSAYYKRQLKLNGVRVVSVLERLDDSPESIILESVLEGMAEYYSANLAREVKKGHNENALQAKHNGGIPPLGFDVGPDRRLVINEFESIAVNIIFTMYAGGHTYQEIIDELNKEKFKTKLRKPFTKTGLHSILGQEKYIGTFIYNRRHRNPDGSYNNHKENKNAIRIEGGCPQIVDTKLWEKVQNRRKANKHKGGRNSAKTVYLLSGKIFCGECGAVMQGHGTRDSKTKTKYSYYVCSKKKRFKTCSLNGVVKEDIENLVLDHLHENVFSDSMIEKTIDKIYNYVNSKNNDTPEMMDTYKKDLLKIEKEIEQTIDLLLSGYRHDSIKNRMDQLEEDKKELEHLIIQKDLEMNRVRYTRREIREFLESFRGFKTMELKQQKKVINIFVHKVIIFEDRYILQIFTNPMDDDPITGDKNNLYPEQSQFTPTIL